MRKNAFLKNKFIVFVFSTKKYTKIMQTEFFYFYSNFSYIIRVPPYRFFSLEIFCPKNFQKPVYNHLLGMTNPTQ